MRILIIEDDDEKLSRVLAFVKREYDSVEISIARSFGSGLREIIKGKNKLELILMDMTMPSFDVTEDEPSGGTPENFAGRDLLAQMKLRSIFTPTIIVTMFDSFGEKPNKISLAQLTYEMKSQYSPPFYDLVYYDSRQEGWQSALKHSMTKLFKGIK
jgi:CheY-like chemotaxis protein